MMLPKSGVYIIRHLPTSTVYVGSSRDIASRWKSHESELTRGCHVNRRLQADWRRDGASAFVWERVEAVEPTDAALGAAEARWLAHYQLVGGGHVYNRRPSRRTPRPDGPIIMTRRTVTLLG